MKGTNKSIPNIGMGSTLTTGPLTTSVTGGPFTTTTAGPGGPFPNDPPTQFIGDGDNLIIGYNLPGVKGTTYFCLKDVYIKELLLSMSASEIPTGDIHFNFLESESKSFTIPDHIPKEQHVTYIKEQFKI